MRTPTPKNQLTQKEEELMQLLWAHGDMYVSQLVALYPDPKPHFNTVSTVIRRLETKGFVAHRDIGGSYQYYPVARKEDIRSHSLGTIIKNYFGGSYYGAVSTLVAEEKITAEQLKELLALVEQNNK